MKLLNILPRRHTFNTVWMGILRYINGQLTSGRMPADEVWDVHGVFLLCDKVEHPDKNYLTNLMR